MVDAQPGGTADEVHDDDELAEAMAADLERWATGAVPIIPPRVQTAPPNGVAASAVPSTFAPTSSAPTPPSRPVPPSRGPQVDAERGFRRQPAPAAGAPLLPVTGPIGVTPIRRRSGFVHPTPLTAVETDPLDRVLPTAPVPLPEATATLLESMIDDSLDDAGRRPRHAGRPVQEQALADALRATGPLQLSPGLYEDWEQSLRSIGRPRQEWTDADVVPAGPDAPTVAVSVQPPAPPRRGAHTAPVEVVDIPVDPATGELEELRPRGRRRAAPVEQDLVAPIAAAEAADEPSAFDLEPSAGPAGPPDGAAAPVPGPRTAPVLIERVRTAILQLPTVPPSATGSGGAALLGRWLGAFASPLLLVAGVALGAAGSGVLGIAGIGLGLLLALPAAARAAAWGIGRSPGEAIEHEVAGPRAGRAVAVVLVLARLAAAAVAIEAVGGVAGAYAARTGTLGGSESSAGLVGVLAVGLAAILATVWPPRVTAVLTLLLAVVGAAVTALLVLVLGPSFGATATPTPSGILAAATAGIAGVGLPLVLVGSDVARWRTTTARPASAIAGTVLAGVAGLGVLVVAVAAAGTPSVGTDPAAAFAAVVADATAAPLAGPLGIALLAASCTLPALLLRSTGAAAARLLGAARSERLGVLATGLFAVAAALGMVAAGAQTADAVVVLAATAGVPVAAWAGAVTAARLRPTAGPAAGIGLLVAAVVGWVLADGVGVAAERSPVLAALGMSGGPWGGAILVGLVAAFLVGIVAGLIGRRGDRPSEGRAAADTLSA